LNIGSNMDYLFTASYLYWGFGFISYFFILFLLIREIMKRFVFLDFQEVEVHHRKSDISRYLRNKIFHGHTFVYAPPASRISAALIHNSNIHLLNMAEIVSDSYRLNLFNYSELPKDTKIPIVLDHFEYRMDNKKINREKLAFLERLINKYKRTVVIISTVDPNYIFSLEKPGDKSENQNSSQSIDVFSWAVILKKFETIYLDESGSKDEINKIIEKYKKKLSSGDKSNSKQRWWEWNQVYPKILGFFIKTEEHQNVINLGITDASAYNICKLLEKECGINSKMCQIAQEILADRQCVFFSNEQLINEILNRAYAYYQVLWSTCSSAEKLMLVQLAEEGLPNLKNAAVVRGLLRRKILIRYPYISLMNESFRRFVLKVFQPEDVLAEQAKSVWNTIKLPLILLIVTMLIFLFMTQKEFLNDTIAIITTFVAIIPAAIKVLGIFLTPKVQSPTE